MEHGTLEANVVVLSTAKEAAGERIYSRPLSAIMGRGQDILESY
jgi:hypothetical protein